MKRFFLFDLGGTLVRYFDKKDFPKLLGEAISGVESLLLERGVIKIPVENIWNRVRMEDYESRNHRVRPLERRLINIFQLSSSVCSKDLMVDMCREFMKPIFSMGCCYKDSIPTLEKLRLLGFKLAVVSNTTWGSPSYLWREEVRRLGLDRYLDDIFFCRDVGWRKPARPIFCYALERLGAEPYECIFVGDNPIWDLIGPRRVGMEAILINRSGRKFHTEGLVLSSLDELFELL